MATVSPEAQPETNTPRRTHARSTRAVHLAACVVFRHQQPLELLTEAEAHELLSSGLGYRICERCRPPVPNGWTPPAWDVSPQRPEYAHACVYRFYDSDDRLLYVGKTVQGPHRWCQHTETAGWWREVATVKVTHCHDDAEARALEREMILTLHPVYNRDVVIG